MKKHNAIQPDQECPCGSGQPFQSCCKDRDDRNTMLEEWIENGYNFARSKIEQKACKIWWMAWDEIQNKIPNSLNSRRSVENNVFDFDVSIFNWISDLAMALKNVARENETYLQPAIQYNKQVLKMFPDEKERFWMNRMQALSRLQQMKGDIEQAIETAQEIIDQTPDKAPGYAALSDVYAFAEEPDYKKAAEIIEQGMKNVSDKEARSYGFENRLEDYRESAGKTK